MMVAFGTRSWWVLFTAVVVGGLALLSCGDDDGGDGSASIAVDATEYEFDPDSWSVPAGESFSVELDNIGRLQHEWTVLGLGQEIESERDFTEDRVLARIEQIPAGESASEEFTIDEAGSYQVVCVIPGHFDAGMEGTLEVG